MENEQFSCNCSNGETEVVSDSEVRHRCGFRPSASYGSLGVWTPYKRVKINGTNRYRWFVDWQSGAVPQPSQPLQET